MKLFRKPLLIEAQGSFAAGGTVIREKGTYEEAHALSPEGQEKHVDHGYVFYQIPADARKNALLFLHGAGQSGACWETAPDGREGFQTLFLRKGLQGVHHGPAKKRKSRKRRSGRKGDTCG